jgi:phosphoribosyl-ATP pyrophosphohydrolase/phosphoribosyl-AMP cyclohydrolase
MSDILELVKYGRDGLVPVITQDTRTDEVLMLAYMNEEALRETIRTGMAHYYSRSRQKLWLKGETSGHYQKVRSISVDCDGDALLLKVEQEGVACHTGHHSCFFTRLDASELRKDAGAGIAEGSGSDTVHTGTGSVASGTGTAGIAEGTGTTDSEENDSDGAAVKAGPEVLEKVFGVILDRKARPKEGSYTNYLFSKGLDKILKKIGEEASEVIIASKNGLPSGIRAEAADLAYHMMVLLAERGMSLDDIYEELKKRAHG